MKFRYQGEKNIQPRVREVLQMLANGSNTREIALVLQLSHQTILSYVTDARIYFEADELADIIEQAEREGFISRQEMSR